MTVKSAQLEGEQTGESDAREPGGGLDARALALAAGSTAREVARVAGAALARGAAASLAGLREVDWGAHAAAAARCSVAAAQRAITAYGPEALAAAAAERPTRVPFRDAAPFAARLAMSRRTRERYPDHVPIIVERLPGSQLPELARQKFLTPADMTNAVFAFNVQRKLTLPPGQGLFLRVRGAGAARALMPSETVGELHAREADRDGFLYLQFREENVFGN